MNAQPDYIRQFKRLLFCIVISFSFTIIEAIAGFYTNSLALVSDAAHNLCDAFALSITAFASWIMSKPISSKRTYGNYRAGILAAFFNALILVVLAIYIYIESWHRFFSPIQVHSDIVIVTALIAFFVNIAIGYIILGDPHSKSLNLKAAIIHVASDAITSLGVVAAGVVIYFTGWYQADALVSVLIATSMLIVGFRILLQAMHVLMESVPKHIDTKALINLIKKHPNIQGLHDLHIWAIADDRAYLTCHVELSSKLSFTEVHNSIMGLRAAIEEKFGIKHSTIQAELPSGKAMKGRSVFCELE